MKGSAFRGSGLVWTRRMRFAGQSQACEGFVWDIYQQYDMIFRLFVTWVA
jgi:hypothetical protein